MGNLVLLRTLDSLLVRWIGPLANFAIYMCPLVHPTGLMEERLLILRAKSLRACLVGDF